MPSIKAARVLQEGPRTIKHHAFRGNHTLQCCIKTAAVKQVIRKEHFLTATDQKIIGPQHGFRTENYKMSKFSFPQVN